MKQEKYMDKASSESTLSRHSTAFAVIVAAVLLSGTLYFVGEGIGNKLTGFAVVADNSAPSADTGDLAPAAPTGNTNPTPTGAIDMAALADDDPVLGSADAPVTIVEFSDFQCPYCARFQNETMGQIKSEYVDTGKVKIVYRDFPLSSIHPYAQKAAEAAECANEQGKFWEYHDTLFTDGGLTVEELKQHAADLGLDTATFNSCLDSGKYAAETAKDMSDGQAAGIRGTPGFIINGQLVSGAQPFSVFQSVIEAALSA